MIAILILTITMIYLSISVSAAPTFDAAAYVVGFRNNSYGYKWKEASNPPVTITFSDPPYSYYLYVAFKTNQIIHDGSIIVVTVTLSNIDSIKLSGAGQLTSSTLVSKTGIKYADLIAIPLNQQIIAHTQTELDQGIQYTITYRATGYTNMYPVVGFNGITIDNNEPTLKIASCDLYESIQDAANSGTTPEEMREVLSSWGEEELLPGIGQEVGGQIEDKVPGAVEDALNNHDQQQETQAGSKIDEFKEQLQEAIDPYFENTSEIRDALHGGLTGVFGYSGTNAVITLPAANNPMADGAQLWPQLTVDLGYWWNQLPAALRSMITIYATFVILYCCLSEMLDTINTILIHRELLGLPDDEFGIRARSRGD